MPYYESRSPEQPTRQSSTFGSQCDSLTPCSHARSLPLKTSKNITPCPTCSRAFLCRLPRIIHTWLLSVYRRAAKRAPAKPRPKKGSKGTAALVGLGEDAPPSEEPVPVGSPPLLPPVDPPVDPAPPPV